jgi:hypothetical protein
MFHGAYFDSADVGTPGYQDVCLEEAKLILPHLAPGGVILIDDSPRSPVGYQGKGGKAVAWLQSLQGWKVLYGGYQVMLRRTLDAGVEVTGRPVSG